LYEKPWGRPQNDGPALRFLAFAKHIKSEGAFSNTTDWWYVPAMPANSPMKRDAEYIAHQWKVPCFDLWEEQFGTHFYTRMVMYSSLKAAVYVANLRKDYGASKFYSTQAATLLDDMDSFWDPYQMIIKSFVAETWSERTSRLDISIILACLHTLDFPVPGFTCTDDKVLLTATKLFYHFKAEYPINWGHKYPLLGRYPTDLYNGTGKSLGNPWILSTHAFAELVLLVASKVDKESAYSVSLFAFSFFDAIVPTIVEKTGPLDEKTRLVLVKALKAAAQEFLDRITQITPSRDLSEQIHRETGALQGARDLTWSYSSYLSVEQRRR
jgi:glucoamylase